jgi:ABC-2 type transport system permease protein
MNLFIAIFRFEWLKLVRSRLLPASFIIFTIISLSAIHNGRRAVQHRLVQLDSIQANYQRDFQLQWNIITDSSADGKKKAATEGLAALVNFRLPQPAVWYPHPLQTLSIGITDIQPSYHLVQTSINYIDPPNIPVSNPVRLFAGNFDLAFVWLYILPLLIIACCYPLYAEEKEAGTVSLLSLQGGKLPRVMALKMIFRMLLISVMVLLLNGIGFVATPGDLSIHFNDALRWCVITQLYILLWTALSWLAVSLRANGTLTALLLMGCWLLLVMIVPAITNIYVAARHPIPLRTELASMQRHESEELWSAAPAMLVDSFNAAYPQFDSIRHPAKDTTFGSVRFIAGYYYLLERRVGEAARLLENQLDERNRYFEALTAINPVMHTQQAFNQLAGSSLHNYRHYRDQVSAFQQKWKSFLLPWQISEKPLGAKQFRQFPQFKPDQAPVPQDPEMTGSSFLYLLIFLPIVGGSILFHRKEQK